MTIEKIDYRVMHGIIFTKDVDGAYRQEIDIPLTHIRELRTKFLDINLDDYNCF